MEKTLFLFQVGFAPTSIHVILGFEFFIISLPLRLVDVCLRTTLCYFLPILSSVAGQRLFITWKTLTFSRAHATLIAVATSEVGPAVLLFVEKVCQVLRFQTNSVR